MENEERKLWIQHKRKCGNCGHVMPLEFEFCPKCGNKLPFMAPPIDSDNFKPIAIIEKLAILFGVLLVFFTGVLPTAWAAWDSYLWPRTRLKTISFQVVYQWTALTYASIIVPTILFGIFISLIISMIILSKKYWKIICENDNCIVPLRDEALRLESLKREKQITQSAYTKRRKRLSQIIYNTKWNWCL